MKPVAAPGRARRARRMRARRSLAQSAQTPPLPRAVKSLAALPASGFPVSLQARPECWALRQAGDDPSAAKALPPRQLPQYPPRRASCSASHSPPAAADARRLSLRPELHAVRHHRAAPPHRHWRADTLRSAGRAFLPLRSWCVVPQQRLESVARIAQPALGGFKVRARHAGDVLDAELGFSLQHEGLSLFARQAIQRSQYGLPLFAALTEQHG